MQAAAGWVMIVKGARATGPMSSIGVLLAPPTGGLCFVPWEDAAARRPATEDSQGEAVKEEERTVRGDYLCKGMRASSTSRSEALLCVGLQGLRELFRLWTIS